LILDLLSEKPRHGYEIMREIEERVGGYYSPSPGSVYPTLQMLEDMGHVRVAEANGKKVYELTDEGRAFVEEQEERMRQHRERMAEYCPPAGRKAGMALAWEMKDLFRNISHLTRRSLNDPEKIKAIKEVLEDARQRVERIVESEKA